MLQLCREADLSEEPLGAEDGRKLGAEHLERDGAVVFNVAGEVHRGHPTAAELTLDRVAARKGRPHALRNVGHVARSLPHKEYDGGRDVASGRARYRQD